MGLHCADCVYSSFSLNEEAGLYQGSCSRGYTLANPHADGLEGHFAERPEELVPTVDPFGNEYLEDLQRLRALLASPRARRRSRLRARGPLTRRHAALAEIDVPLTFFGFPSAMVALQLNPREGI